MDGALLLTLAVVALTTLPPLVPNSALIAAAGALAATGRIPLPLVLLTVAGSALAGDALMYGLGRRTGARLRRRLSRGRRRAALEWTQERVGRYGVPFVIAVRFLPSGRIVGGLATGAAGYPVRRFLLGSGLAELLWAVYSVGVGYWGGRALAGTLSGALIGIGASAVLGAAGRRVGAAAAAAADALPFGSAPARASVRRLLLFWRGPGRRPGRHLWCRPGVRVLRPVLGALRPKWRPRPRQWPPRCPGLRVTQSRTVSAYQYGLPPSTRSGGGSRPCFR
ncbi:VTT domain-containing protein [Streptomyces sp. GKU 257-1]|nr:VTT domain-containing protein [Streptomyces sp. GKU 257-1]